MNQLSGICKISFTSIRLFLYVFLSLECIHFIINISLAAFGINTHTEVSHANTAAAFLLIIPVILPIFTFKQALFLGASRSSYFWGTIIFLILASCIAALLNTVWYYVEIHILSAYKHYFNIIRIFEWNKSGTMGIFLYQFFAYLPAMAFVHLLFSGFWSRKGIALWLVSGAVISVSVSVGILRQCISLALQFLLYRSHLFISMGCELLLTAAFFFTCWHLFIKQRQV